MKTLILYFNGTGNTYFIAGLIHKRLIEERINTDIESVEIFPPENTNEYDLLIFGFPIYSCDMPGFLNGFVKNLSITKTKGIILFATMGFYGFNALYRASKKFTKAGFVPLLTEEIKLPGSDGLLFIKKESRFANKILSKDYRKLPSIKKAVENIVNKVLEIKNANPLNSEDANIPLFNVWAFPVEFGLKIAYPAIENLLKRKFWVNDRCTKCGICIEVCPAKNIHLKNDKVAFSDNCYSCLRCVHQCPEEAIQIGRFTMSSLRWKGPDQGFNPYKMLKKSSISEL